jgi:hypothetical protein
MPAGRGRWPLACMGMGHGMQQPAAGCHAMPHSHHPEPSSRGISAIQPYIYRRYNYRPYAPVVGIEFTIERERSLIVPS